MNYLKFNGVLEEIIERYPNIDISEFLEQKLNIPQCKAEELSARIEKEYFQKTNEKKTIKTILENPNKHEIAPKASIYPLCSLSEKEFENFIIWLFEELGYRIHPEKHSTETGVDLVAAKNGEKIAIQTRRYSKRYKVSNSIILLALEARNTFESNRSIVVATTYFTQQTIEDAKKFGIELWDSDILDEKITEAKKNADLEEPSFLPQYRESLLNSLLGLEDTKQFLIEPKAYGKYDLHLPGVKFPLLTFQVQLGEITRCVYRIKNNEPVGESEGTALISNDRSNNRFGPDDIRAYALITQYLKQFLE
jgi:hypothetical protein